MIGAALLIPLAVSAAPYLVSDPWPADAAQPELCVYQEGQIQISAPVSKDITGAARCMIDLGSVAAGTHNLQVWAWSASALSSPPVKFTFSRGTSYAAKLTGYTLVFPGTFRY
jgi:hypothetical protein